MKRLLFPLLLMLSGLLYGQGSTIPWQQLLPPDTMATWVQPGQGKPAMPVWGHVNGIRIGLDPLPGPRGLIRIYTPYLDYPFPEVMNFIAFEPIPKGQEQRGFSELEMSNIHPGKRGKHFWSANSATDSLPLDGLNPARGIVEEINGEQTLTVYIFSEPFDNGAKVYTRIRFFASRPYEFELATYTYEGAQALDYFIATATMGNKARLRTLFLEDGQQSSLALWPDYKDIHFTPHAYFSQQRMLRDKKGRAYFIAAPDETDYRNTVYSAATHSHWKYRGKRATQYWIKNTPSEQLKGLVTGRFTYWASREPIPGGVSIENFEMKEPFTSGETYVFGITPLSPEALIRQIKQ
ncbi:MAG: hypothetical protein LBF27_02930 [Sphingobacterium sp.]|nr:hypothetical protein [Sphingobacterium sp.]